MFFLTKEYYIKWWKKENNNNPIDCSNFEDKMTTTPELTFGKIGGIFILVAFSLCLAVLVVSMEFVWKVKNSAKNTVSIIFVFLTLFKYLLFFNYKLLKQEFCQIFSKGINSIFADFFKKKFKNIFFKSQIQQQNQQQAKQEKMSRKKMNRLKKKNNKKKHRAAKFNKLKQKQASLKKSSSLLSSDKNMYH